MKKKGKSGVRRGRKTLTQMMMNEMEDRFYHRERYEISHKMTEPSRGRGKSRRRKGRRLERRGENDDN